MRKVEKRKREAEKFETRYKKIKFFEKKKIIRRLERIDKEIQEVGTDEEDKKADLLKDKQKYKNYLTYVNNYPDTQKYLSLFPTGEDAEKSKAQRDEMMVKILKIAEVKAKLREKELLEMDKPEVDEEAEDSEMEEVKTKKQVKEIAKKDTFFTEEEAVEPSEKKVVQRNGWVVDPKK